MRFLKRLILLLTGLMVLLPSAAWAKKPDYRYKVPKYKYKKPKIKKPHTGHHPVPYHPKVRH